jgi:hypothetical protein
METVVQGAAAPSHFGNPARSDALKSMLDPRRLCGPRSRGVCLYRLTFKEGGALFDFWKICAASDLKGSCLSDGWTPDAHRQKLGYTT